MRVIQVIKVKGIAGAERHLLDLMGGLVARNIEVHLVALIEPNSDAADEMLQLAAARGVTTHRETIHRMFDLDLLRRLRRLFVTLKPDVVHTHLPHADLHAIPLARLLKVRLVLRTIHNQEPRRIWLTYRLMNHILWRLSHAGIAISDSVKQFTQRVEWVDDAKLHRIHYGYPMPPPVIDKVMARDAVRAMIPTSEEAIIAGMVCRLMDAKGLPYAVNAVGQLTRLFTDLHLVIVGDGPLRESLEQQAQRQGLVNRVHFMGWQQNPTEWIAGFDLLLMPSTREGFGMTMLEAMSQQIPIIGSTAGAIPEVVQHGETGLTVPPRDATALAGAIRMLIEDKPLRMHMGLLGEDRLEATFTADRMIDETLNLYKQYLSR